MSSEINVSSIFTSSTPSPSSSKKRGDPDEFFSSSDDDDEIRDENKSAEKRNDEKKMFDKPAKKKRASAAEEETEEEGQQQQLLPLGTLLTHRDLRMESFLQRELEEVTKTCPAPADASPDEVTRLWTRQLAARVSSQSAVLWNRLSPVAAILISQKLREAHKRMMVSLVRTAEPLQVMAHKYKTLFNTWVDSVNCVSFVTGNKRALGGLSPKDYWIIQYFILGTCERARTDNLLQIGVVGRTTVGKSTLFEAPLTGSSHYYVGDAGVGRFKVEDKTILFFHDVDVNDLCFGRDRDLIKTLARGEATQAKVHGSTVAVPSLHLFYTSNTKMFNHHLMTTLVPPPPPPPHPAATTCNLLRGKGGGGSVKNSNGNNKNKLFHQQAGSVQKNYFALDHHQQQQQPSVKTFKSDILASATNNPNQMLHLDAMKHRFIECFCAEKPPLDTTLLPRNGSFHREHMVLGIYERVLDLLERVYQPADFKEMPALAEYAITGLAKRARLAYQHLPSLSHDSNDDTVTAQDDIDSFLNRIVFLSVKYVSLNSPQQHEFILNLLNKV